MKSLCVAFSYDGARIMLSGSFDRTIRVWEAASGAEVLLLRANDPRLSSVAFFLLTEPA